MPEYQPVSLAYLSAIERPRCPMCNQSRMLLSKLETRPSGCEYRTFECHKCGRVHTTVASSNALKSGMLGWLAGELKPPT
jgi:transposase-like protein